MTSPQLEKIFYHHIVNDVELSNMAKPEYFETEFIREVFRIAKSFVAKYRDTPSLKQIYESGKISGKLEKKHVQKLQLLYKHDPNEFDKEWLTRNAEGWMELRALDTTLLDLITYRKTTKVDMENVSEVIETSRGILEKGTNISFDFEEGLDFFNAEHHIQPTWDTFSTGYSYLDTVLGGGWTSKSLYIIAGENKIGKSIWLANLIAAAVKNGHNSAFVSFEMRSEHVIKRLGANLLNISIKEYNEISKDSDLIKIRLSNIGFDTLQAPGKLFVKEYPTSAASVKDVERYLMKMEERRNMKFKVVFVDYINIMMNWRNPNSENTYMKIKQIAEDLRAMGKRNNWAVVSVTQINRSGFGASGRLSLSSIAESSGLGHTVDWMGGIIQDELMYANNEYLLQTMLNRNEGYKNSRKKFNINYDFMRITEDAESEIILSATD